ncbi:MAG TPA: AMP-binding protein, partial [Myxococcaceae bacterium]|nr:AMP-binding protein [Myxococcaceae bacterium]
MLEGFTPWPEERARLYRERGYWEGVTIFEMVARTAARHPEKTALIAGERRIGYRELIDTAERLAARFAEAGLRPLDRVVLQLPNTPDFAFV